MYRGNEAEDAIPHHHTHTYMKTFRTVSYLIIIAAVVGGIAFGLRSEKVRGFFSSFNAERDEYRTHHEPTPDCYYTVESISTAGSKTFIIGRNMQPVMKPSKTGDMTISLEPYGSLREIEVPSNKVGLKASAAFFTVKSVDGVPTLILFQSQVEVLKSAMNARNTPPRT